LSLSDIKTDGNILPMPSLSVEKRTLDGSDYAVLVVTPSDAPPVRYKGRAYVRVGPRRAVATPQDERILSERRRSRDLPFELQKVVGASLSDLDRRLFEEDYLPSAFAPDVLAQNGRTYEERLASLRMVHAPDDPVPTVLGLLVLSPRARDFIGPAYVQFLRLDGTDLASPILDAEEISGPIGQLLRRLDDKLLASNTTKIDLTSASREVRRPEYPMAALQQITRNAIMHRTYEGSNAPIKLTWFSDRIEVLSPGGPFGIVNRENFGRAGVSDYRNRSLAEAMKTLGFVQRFGVGIATASKQLALNGNPPLTWDVEDTYVLFTLRRAP
jgi:ATP-dependent DNA helicase RecG